MDENLLQEVKELRFLVGTLLARSGLDADGIERAFKLARETVADLDARMMDLAGAHFRETPEGRVRHAELVEERRSAERQAWKEACIEDGRITPDPTRRT